MKEMQNTFGWSIMVAEFVENNTLAGVDCFWNKFPIKEGIYEEENCVGLLPKLPLLQMVIYYIARVWISILFLNTDKDELIRKFGGDGHGGMLNLKLPKWDKPPVDKQGWKSSLLCYVTSEVIIPSRRFTMEGGNISDTFLAWCICYVRPVIH